MPQMGKSWDGRGFAEDVQEALKYKAIVDQRKRETWLSRRATMVRHFLFGWRLEEYETLTQRYSPRKSLWRRICDF